MSRQTEAFEVFKADFIRLMVSDKTIGSEMRVTIVGELQNLFDVPSFQKNMMQAFSNFMWGMDATIERGVYDELEVLLDMLPKIVKDPEDDNVLAIQAQLTQMIAVGKKPVEDMPDAEIDELTDDLELDDSRPAGI